MTDTKMLFLATDGEAEISWIKRSEYKGYLQQCVNHSQEVEQEMFEMNENNVEILYCKLKGATYKFVISVPL